MKSVISDDRTEPLQRGTLIDMQARLTTAGK